MLYYGIFDNPIARFMKLLVKKSKSIYTSKNGFVKPLFEINEQGDLKPINQKEYPNNGNIFVFDYELLNNHVNTDLFFIDNCFFISDDNNFVDRSSDPNTSKKRISYNNGISGFFSEVLPNLYIPVYTNKFNFEGHRLTSSENIISNIFFLKDLSKDYLYGPFERDNFDLKAVTFKSYDYEDNDYKEFLDFFSDFDGSVVFKTKYENVEKHIIRDIDGNEYVKNFVDIFKENIDEPIEYTPISILHKWVLGKLQNKPFRITNFLEEIENIETNFNSTLDKLKWRKYLEFIDGTQKQGLLIDSLVTKLYEKGYVEDVAGNSKIEIIEKELQNLRNTDQIKSEEIIKLKDIRDGLELELNALREKGAEIVDIDKYPNLASVINDSQNLLEIDNLIATKHNYETLNDELKKLEGKREALEETIKRSEESERRINDSIRIIKQNFDNDVSVHTAKLADAKMYTDLLNGINVNPKNKHFEDNETKTIALTPLPSEINNAKAYVIEIQKRLKNLNRELSYNDVANLIITINQSFLTIIAGAPGIGKTSLVNKLSKAYGLEEEFGYLEINCARGWTSSRDLLGFYNPLTGNYQSSKTHLRRSLLQSSMNLNAPYIVLLDEANLSPIEHYWSDFIKLADNDYARKIKISDNEEIVFGDGFRFIATINHDHTTEALSNRLLDRASIIQLDKPFSINEYSVPEERIVNVFDFKEVQKLFQETSKWKSDEELIKKFLQEIKDKIESSNSGIVISPRKEVAIRKYCKVGTGVLDGNTYTALDFAVSQHILPLINGRGEKFEDLLKDLKNDVADKGMVKSMKIISKILDRGKDLKHFKYIFY